MANTGEKEKSQQQLLKAYRAVFGSEGKRTQAQKIVLADLEYRGRIWRNTWIPDSDSMRMDPYRGCIAEGERLFAIRTIQMANSKPGDEPKKPTVKKGKAS